MSVTLGANPERTAEIGERPEPAPQPARTRRTVSSTILSAFHFACDIRETAIAGQLLVTLEAKLHEERDAGGLDSARILESLVACHERLWTLRTTRL